MSANPSNQGAPVLPFYVVCDESSSMAGESIDAVNQGIGELLRTIHVDPTLDKRSRVGIVTFNDTARVLLPLTRLSAISSTPGCVATGSTSYASVFRLLKTQIESDIPALKTEGFRVHRPMIFFISDGSPNLEDWQTAYAELTDQSFAFRPNIVSFGIAGASASVIKEVSTPLPVGSEKSQSFAFLAEQGVNPGAAVNEIMKFIIETIVNGGDPGQSPLARI